MASQTPDFASLHPGYEGQGTKSPPLGYGSGEGTMTILRWAIIMLLVSLVAALLGFTDLSAASADVARVLFYIFGVIFLVLLVLGFTVFRSSRP
jgi:uncharacterized membrane protein YtjA (UPF0391 family)